MQIEQAINSVKSNKLKPRKALNKAFLKVKPNRSLKEELKGIRMVLLELRAENNFSLEADIDRLVYELYWLNAEEIGVIKGSVG